MCMPYLVLIAAYRVVPILWYRIRVVHNGDMMCQRTGGALGDRFGRFGLGARRIRAPQYHVGCSRGPTFYLLFVYVYLFFKHFVHLFGYVLELIFATYLGTFSN